MTHPPQPKPRSLPRAALAGLLMAVLAAHALGQEPHSRRTVEVRDAIEVNHARRTLVDAQLRLQQSRVNSLRAMQRRQAASSAEVRHAEADLVELEARRDAVADLDGLLNRIRAVLDVAKPAHPPESAASVSRITIDIPGIHENPASRWLGEIVLDLRPSDRATLDELRSLATPSHRERVAEAEVRFRTQQLALLKSVKVPGAVSPRELEVRDTELQIAQARLALAELTARLARRRLDCQGLPDTRCAYQDIDLAQPVQRERFFRLQSHRYRLRGEEQGLVARARLLARGVSSEGDPPREASTAQQPPAGLSLLHAAIEAVQSERLELEAMLPRKVRRLSEPLPPGFSATDARQRLFETLTPLRDEVVEATDLVESAREAATAARDRHRRLAGVNDLAPDELKKADLEASIAEATSRLRAEEAEQRGLELEYVLGIAEHLANGGNDTLIRGSDESTLGLFALFRAAASREALISLTKLEYELAELRLEQVRRLAAKRYASPMEVLEAELGLHLARADREAAVRDHQAAKLRWTLLQSATSTRSARAAAHMESDEK